VSSEVLARHAEGWDWIGINLDDGSALMAFRIRGKAGATLWAAARCATRREGSARSRRRTSCSSPLGDGDPRAPGSSTR